MSFKTQLESDLSVFFNDDEFSDEITWDGETISAIIDYGENLDQYSNRGNSKAVKAQVRVKVFDVSEPTYGTAVVINSTTWKVKKTLSGDGYEWLVEIARDVRPGVQV